MSNNDSTYLGVEKKEDFYFYSPTAPLPPGIEKEERNLVFLSEQKKQKWATFIKENNAKHNLELPEPDDLTSYDNSDYLWLSCEMESLRRLYNIAMQDPNAGKTLSGCGQIPYIQLRLKWLAYSKESRYPQSTVNNYGFDYKPHYVVEFEKAFLNAFMNFLAAVFDDNPQEYFKFGTNNIVIHQYKAPIYRNSAFSKYFETRHDLPGNIFAKAVQTLLAHEIAHVGLGHLDLKAADPTYGNLVDTLIVEEDDADEQAISWVLREPFSNIVNSRTDLSHIELFKELSLTIFSFYVLFTWDYSKEERVWSDSTIAEYGHKGHFPYQLRAFNMLQYSFLRLKLLGEWSEKEKILTKDDKQINVSLMECVYEEALDMIDAFEKSLHMFFAKTEDVVSLALDENFEELKRIMYLENQNELPMLTKENIPWMLGNEPNAQQEMQRVRRLGKAVRERLVSNGAYCVLEI